MSLLGPLIKVGGSLLGGLLGKKKSVTPRDNLLSQAAGARDAAEKYGFNPLTMLQYGQTGASTGGVSGPSLMSNELMLGAIQEVSDVLSGDKARRDAKEQLDIDLKKVQLETLRSGVVQYTPRATDAVGSGRAVLGSNTGTFTPSNVSSREKLAFDPYESSKSNIREDIATDGSNVRPTIGPDFDEMLMGFLINEHGKAKWRKTANTLNGAMAPLRGGFGISASTATPIPHFEERPIRAMRGWRARLGGTQSRFTGSESEFHDF